MLCGVFSENIGCTITCVELARRLKTMPSMAMFLVERKRSQFPPCDIVFQNTFYPSLRVVPSRLSAKTLPPRY
jgi:hypothetical protein